MQLPALVLLAALRAAPVAAGTEKTLAPTALYARPGDRRDFCLEERDCEVVSADQGLTTFAARDDFRIKGCYSKNGKVFFSRGTMEEMTRVDLPGKMERIYCDAPAPSPKPPPTPAPTPPRSPSGDAPAGGPALCSDEYACRRAAAAQGFAPFAASNAFRTKGCYAKNGKGFFSPGTAKEMTRFDLPGAQERIYCDAPAPSPKPPPTPAPTPPRSPSGDAPAGGPALCSDEYACRRAAAARDLAIFYASPNFATKGCYAKNGKAFFSPGSSAAMAQVNLPGTKERLYC